MHFLLLHEFIIAHNKNFMLEIHGTNVRMNVKQKQDKIYDKQ